MKSMAAAPRQHAGHEGSSGIFAKICRPSSVRRTQPVSCVIKPNLKDSIMTFHQPSLPLAMITTRRSPAQPLVATVMARRHWQPKVAAKVT
jgi:hypothetical protein